MIFFGLQHIKEESKQLREALRENSNVTHFTARLMINATLFKYVKLK